MAKKEVTFINMLAYVLSKLYINIIKLGLSRIYIMMLYFFH